MASASDLQEQDLNFYSTHEHSLISPQNTLSLIVHEPSNYPSWLVSGIVQQALSPNSECFLSPQAPLKPNTPSPVILLSFTNTLQTYSKYTHKYITQNKDFFTFISFLTDTSIPLESWNQKVVNQLSTLKSSKPIVIIENPELLLSIVPNMTTSKLLSQLHSIQKLSALYIVTSTSNTPISSQSLFLPSLLHHSSMIVSLTSLTTGRADDISGILSISSGPKHLVSNDSKIADLQYSYLVTTSGVKLYYK